MKKLITALLLVPTLVFGQRTVTLSSTDKAVTLNGSVWPKNTLVVTINPSDSTKASITRAADGGIVVAMQAISYYKRSSGAAFTKTELLAFCDSFMYAGLSAAEVQDRTEYVCADPRYVEFREGLLFDDRIEKIS